MAIQKRYLVVIDFYVYADSEGGAMIQASNRCDIINNKDDSKAEVQVVTESMFGQIGKGKEVFKNAKSI